MLQFESKYAEWLYKESQRGYDWEISETDQIITEEFIYNMIQQLARRKNKITRFRVTWE